MTHEERINVLRDLDPGLITDTFLHFGIGSWILGLVPMNSEMKIYGRATTAQFLLVTKEEEMLSQYEVIECCEEGDIMVWSSPIRENIIGGNIFTFLAKNKRKLGGLILDGTYRDYDQIKAAGAPFFAKGPCAAPPPGNYKATKRSVNIPITVGGATVNPGDYLIGDINGIMVIPKNEVDRVLEQALKFEEWEILLEKAIASGADSTELKTIYAQRSEYEL